MSVWAFAIASLITAMGILIVRQQVRARNELTARLHELEERTATLESEWRRSSDNVAVLQRLLLEKGVADEEDFEAARRADEIESTAHPRDVH